MRNYLTKLLTAVLLTLFTALPAAAYDFMVDGICYNYNADGNSVTVTYERDPSLNNPSYVSASGSLNIPSSVYYNGKTYSVTAIGRDAFWGCSGFTGTLSIPNSVTSIGTAAFLSCTGFTGTLTIPNSVTEIGDYVFSGCSGFTGSLTIGNSVTSIGGSAFANCRGFTGSLTIPNSVTYIGGDAFAYCSGFTGSLTIPNSVTDIGDGAFEDCSGFTGSLTIPNSVTSIGPYAFYDCRGFTGSLTIPESVTSIGQYAFAFCSGFTGSLTIPNSVTSIGNEAFRYCRGFTGSLTIGNSVSFIGNYAFQDCSGFTSIKNYIPHPSNVSLGSSVFSGISKSSCTLYVPQGTVEEYRAADQWKDFTSILEWGILVTSISVSPSSTSLNVGQTTTLSATVLPSNATDKAVTWSSSNTSVATVNQSGKVTALSAGQTTITATTTDGTNLSSTCAVTVLQITVMPTSATLNVGQSTTLTATVLPSTAIDKTVTWQSSNPDVVSITPDGTRCMVTAMAVGTATITITVTTNDGSNLTASCPVTVSENVWNQPVMYLRPKGTMYCNWDNTGSGYIMPYVNTKPYDTVTWRNVSSAQGSPEWTYQLWNIESASSESHASNDRDLTVRYGNENVDVPTLTMGSAGSYTMSGYRVNRTTGAIETSAVCRVAAATNSNMLCSAHYYGSSNRFGTEKYGWTWYNGAKGPNGDDDTSGYWFGKNYSGWNVFGCGFEKPISPYVLNKIYFWTTNVAVSEDVELEARVYRIGDELPAYNDTTYAEIDPATLTEANLIATGRTTITTDMNNSSPMLQFTLYETDPELGIEYEITPQINDAIVILIVGMDQDAIESISGLVTNDVEDEGVGEVTFLGAQQDGVITSCRGLNNFFSSGQMKAGSSILIDVTRPFITFNYNFEEGEYTFPDTGGTLAYNLGGETYNGIDFLATSPKADWTVTTVDGADVPDWLSITLADVEENGEWTGVVNANVTAAALPYYLDYRDAFLRFAIHGGYIDYHFIQIYPGLRCDVNADGTLDVHDVNAVINLIMGYDTQYRDRADITTDGKVNVADLNAVINALLGRTTGAATNSRNMAKQGGLHKMKSGFTTSSGSSATVMTRKNASVDAGSKADSATPRVNGKGQAQHVTADETLVAPAVQLKARNPRP